MPPRGSVVLMIEPDQGLVRAVKRRLTSARVRVHVAPIGPAAVEEVARIEPQVVLLDLTLPGVDGLDLLRRFRATSAAQVIALSLGDDPSRIVAALDAGADDHVTIPFAMAELEARVRVALRHFARQKREMVVTRGGLTLDLERQTVTAAGVPVHLTPSEFSLCQMLMASTEPVGARDMLEALWGADAAAAEPQFVRTIISQLRSKLGHVVLIANEPGVGYCLTALPGVL